MAKPAQSLKDREALVMADKWLDAALNRVVAAMIAAAGKNDGDAVGRSRAYSVPRVTGQSRKIRSG